MLRSVALLVVPLLFAEGSALSRWPAPKAPVIRAADGYIAIPNAAVPPDRNQCYRAVFDATQGAAKPAQILPALNMAGSELNAFAVAAVPSRNVHFAVVFHGAAMDGLLDDPHYRSKFGVGNPNLPVLDALKKAGVDLFVCGQNLAASRVDPATLSPAVAVASDALIVLMVYQNRGYALLSF